MVRHARHVGRVWWSCVVSVSGGGMVVMGG